MRHRTSSLFKKIIRPLISDREEDLWKKILVIGLFIGIPVALQVGHSETKTYDLQLISPYSQQRTYEEISSPQEPKKILEKNSDNLTNYQE